MTSNIAIDECRRVIGTSRPPINITTTKFITIMNSNGIIITIIGRLLLLLFFLWRTARPTSAEEVPLPSAARPQVQ